MKSSSNFKIKQVLIDKNVEPDEFEDADKDQEMEDAKKNKNDTGSGSSSNVNPSSLPNNSNQPQKRQSFRPKGREGGKEDRLVSRYVA